MNKFRNLVSLIVLVCSAPAFSQASETPTVLVLGDSLSAGYGIDVDQSWVALLQTRLQDEGYEHRVVNASVSGETTAGGSRRIKRALSLHKPDVVIIELGGNDGLRGLPVAQVRKNMLTMIEASLAAGSRVVMLGMRIPRNYGARYSEGLEKVFVELAADYDLPWIEFFLDGVALDKSLMQSDGIHPNADAQPILLDNAWDAIAGVLPAQAVD